MQKKKISMHEALIYIMVVMSAADSDMTDAELIVIRDIVATLPIFKDFDAANLTKAANECVEMLAGYNGLDAVLEASYKAIPTRLRETAYAIAVEVAAVDLHAAQEELRLLQMIRHILQLDRLITAGIERGARARYCIG